MATEIQYTFHQDIPLNEGSSELRRSPSFFTLNGVTYTDPNPGQASRLRGTGGYIRFFASETSTTMTVKTYHRHSKKSNQLVSTSDRRKNELRFLQHQYPHAPCALIEHPTNLLEKRLVMETIQGVTLYQYLTRLKNSAHEI